MPVMPEKTVSSQLIYEGRVVKLRLDTVVTPDGRESKREIVEHRGAVAMVAIDAEDNLLLVRQFRKPTEKVLLELPAGTLEAGEALEATVIREMQEETGYRPRKIQSLGGFYSAPGFCSEYIHLFLVTDLVPARLEGEDTAEIELVKMPIGEAKRLVDGNTICDSKSIIGILKYLEHLKKQD
ncbi:MAG: NUDIX hydrolase [Chloroflexota bacterium]